MYINNRMLYYCAPSDIYELYDYLKLNYNELIMVKFWINNNNKTKPGVCFYKLEKINTKINKSGKKCIIVQLKAVYYVIKIKEGDYYVKRIPEELGLIDELFAYIKKGDNYILILKKDMDDII